MTVEDEEYIDIKSKPIYVPMEFDPKSRWSLLIGETEGLRGLIDLSSNSSAMQAADTTVMYAGSAAERADAESYFNSENCDQIHQFDNQEALLTALKDVLANSKMGLRLYICGAEAFI